MNKFEFSVLSALRAAQLQRGCTPRVPPCQKAAVTAQHEIAAGKVTRFAAAADLVPERVD
jgi:DNA-directed RNA polymerase subunit K/omega